MSYRNEPLQHRPTGLLLLPDSELCLAHQNTVTTVELNVGPPVTQQVLIQYHITLRLDKNILELTHRVIIQFFLMYLKCFLHSENESHLCKLN